ncbi:hypothetical protein B0H10DRAFT_1804144 [Mycena sp. CBHHK59/15]|nr:hypothetical protein B0H10DRAFT_1804144 [Mycena sp. CBHHK59/15]
MTTADWLCILKWMAAFLAGMGGMSVFKQRNPSIVVEFVPMTSDPSMDGDIQIVKDMNGFERGVITQAWFIKQAERQRAG